MSQTTVSIRMDNELKNNFDHICTELGMSMSTAVTISFRWTEACLARTFPFRSISPAIRIVVSIRCSIW